MHKFHHNNEDNIQLWAETIMMFRNILASNEVLWTNQLWCLLKLLWMWWKLDCVLRLCFKTWEWTLGLFRMLWVIMKHSHDGVLFPNRHCVVPILPMLYQSANHINPPSSPRAVSDLSVWSIGESWKNKTLAKEVSFTIVLLPFYCVLKMFFEYKLENNRKTLIKM